MNGLRPSRDTTSTPTERTPLLTGSSRSTTPQDATTSPLLDGRPHVGSFVAEMRPEDLRKYTLDNLYPPTLRSPSAQTAFSLCALLYFRTYLAEASPRGRDVWAQWRQDHRNATALHDADALVVQVWEHFLEEEGSSEDVKEVLWSEYPLYPHLRRSVRVFDFLANGDAPAKLLSHPLVHTTAVDAWKYGLFDEAGNEGISSRLLHFLDSNGTPRALHLFDLLVYLAFLGLLCNYLIDPPYQTEVATSDTRSTLLSLYALSKLFTSWSSATLPFSLVILSFLISIPLPPLPDTFAYTLLLLAFSWKILLLHIPVQPSPLFLLPPEQMLPLAVLVWRGLARTFVPIVAFFIPGLFISLVLLSTSLNDRLLFNGYATLTMIPSPMASRVVFLALFTVIFIFLCCALGFSVLIHPFLAPHEGPARSSWDRYSSSVGLEARQAYIRAVRTYSTPYYFPAPLNILHILFVRIPRAAFILAGHKATPRSLEVVEEVLWRVTVAPFTFAISTLWLWNLRTRW